MDEKNKKAWQDNREKTDRILAGGRIPDGEIRVCDVEKYYGSDTNITKAVDRVSFCVQKENLWESWEHRVPERQHF